MIRVIPLLSVLLVCLLALQATIQAQPEDAATRLQTASMLAFGRPASPADFAGNPSLSMDALLRQGRDRIQKDPALRRAVEEKAYIDAFGQRPSSPAAAASTNGHLYLELVAAHVTALSNDFAAYERVLNRAYRVVVRRDMYSMEADYWKQRKPMSYVFVVAILESWARRNQPGLMVTSGDAIASINSDYLSVQRLSPTLAAEVHSALQTFDAGIARNGILAAGAASAASAGNISFTAVGGAALLDNLADTP